MNANFVPIGDQAGRNAPDPIGSSSPLPSGLIVRCYVARGEPLAVEASFPFLPEKAAPAGPENTSNASTAAPAPM